MPDPKSLPLLDTGASRRRPDQSREPSQRVDPGFDREPWIPAGVYPDGNRGRNDILLVDCQFMDRLYLATTTDWHIRTSALTFFLSSEFWVGNIPKSVGDKVEGKNG